MLAALIRCTGRATIAEILAQHGAKIPHMDAVQGGALQAWARSVCGKSKVKVVP